jgi:hypothetical protein
MNGQTMERRSTIQMSSATIKYNIHNYEDAEEVLKGREQKKIGHNTWLIRRDPDTIVVKYHRTNIVVYVPGWMECYADGWETYTTKDRLNQLLPAGWSICQVKHRWYVRNHATGEQSDWYDGITFST